jgi:hypothetical protein
MEHTPWWRTRSGIVLIGFLAIAGFFLWTEHRAHLLGALPYALLLACPLMHHFMHGGHGHGHGSAHDSQRHDTPSDEDQRHGA